MNEVKLIGNVGGIEQRKASMPVSKINLAVNKSKKDKNGQWIKETTWVSVVCFGKTATEAQANVSKGDRIFVEGALKVDNYTDKAGNKRTQTYIAANSVLKFAPIEKATVQPETDNQADFGDDLPF